VSARPCGFPLRASSPTPQRARKNNRQKARAVVHRRNSIVPATRLIALQAAVAIRRDPRPRSRRARVFSRPSFFLARERELPSNFRPRGSIYWTWTVRDAGLVKEIYRATEREFISPVTRISIPALPRSPLDRCAGAQLDVASEATHRSAGKSISIPHLLRPRIRRLRVKENEIRAGCTGTT